MENQDKLFEQFKKAAEHSETKDFPAMEKVWSRVEEKLDNKVLQKESQLWKKIAVAASLLLLFTLGYQFFKPETNITIPENEIVNETDNNSTVPGFENKQEEIVTTENPLIKKDADKIVNNQIDKQTQIGFLEKSHNELREDYISKDTVATNGAVEESDALSKSNSNSNQWLSQQHFSAISVKHAAKEEAESSERKKAKAESTQKKAEPLVVLDGKAVTTKSKGENFRDGVTHLDPEDVETIEILKEPLYIINGVHYSEEELFGPNPTSPYAPLNNQEIESTSILQGEMAVSLYGEKGKKGVVIITTKNGKPVKK